MKNNHNNVKVNEVSKRNHFNVKDNVSKRLTIQQVQSIADKLAKKFDSPDDINFFRKCAWHLPESEIWSIAEVATTPGRTNSPIRYFTAACRNQLRLRGY